MLQERKAKPHFSSQVHFNQIQLELGSLLDFISLEINTTCRCYQRQTEIYKLVLYVLCVLFAEEPCEVFCVAFFRKTIKYRRRKAFCSLQ